MSESLYNRKDTEKSVRKNFFRYICQFVISIFAVSMLYFIGVCSNHDLWIIIQVSDYKL